MSWWCFLGFHDWKKLEGSKRPYNSRGGGERGSATAWDPGDSGFEEVTDQCKRCGKCRERLEHIASTE